MFLIFPETGENCSTRIFVWFVFLNLKFSV